MPASRALYLRRNRKEEVETRYQKHSGRSRADWVMDKTRSLSVPDSPKEITLIPKARSFPSSRATPPSPSSSSLSPISTPPHTATSSTPPRQGHKEKIFFLETQSICRVDRDEYKRGRSSKKKNAKLGLLFKMNSVDGKTMECPHKFPNGPGLITCLIMIFVVKCFMHIHPLKVTYIQI